MRQLKCVAIILPLFAAACNKSDSAPAGQVVATVDGKEITNEQLRMEMSAMPANAQRQDFALQSLVDRAILVKEAEQQKLDQMPATAVAKARAEQGVLVQMLTQKIQSSVPAVSAEEVAQYVTDNPAKFAHRHIYVLDQIVVMKPGKDTIDAIARINSFTDIKAWLDSQKVAYRGTMGSIDTLALPDETAKSVAALAPDAAFAVRGPDVIRVNRIKEAFEQPIPDDDAKKLAREQLMARRTSDIVQGKLKQIVETGRATVKYNPEFAPKK